MCIRRAGFFLASFHSEIIPIYLYNFKLSEVLETITNTESEEIVRKEKEKD